MTSDFDVSPVLRLGAPLGRTLGPRTGALLLNRRAETTGPIFLDEATVVWWRRYRKPIMDPRLMDPDFRVFSAEALEAALHSAMSACTVYNPLGSEGPADWKARQIRLASHCGLNVPDSLISMDRDEIEEFVDRVERSGRRVVYKHASAIAAFGMPTRVVDAQARARFEDLSHAPSTFQAEITGGYDLRIAVIGTAVYCCEWRGAAGTRTYVDVRLEDGLRMHRVEVPSSLRAPLSTLHSRLGLVFGVYDFKADGDGRPFFLEVNPSGQWLDMEIEGQQPISESVARVLVEGCGVEVEVSDQPFSSSDLDIIYGALAPERELTWNRVH